MKDYQNIKVCLFDLDGTIYLGDKPIPNAIEKLNEITSKGIKVGFLTNNSSKSTDEYLVKLSKMGYRAVGSQIVSSSMSAAKFIRDNYPDKSVFVLGTKSLKDTIESYGIKICDDADIALIGFDTSLCYANLLKFVRLLQKGRTYIATHHDINCPSEEGDMPDVGSLMALIEKSTGQTPEVICGKPYKPMVDFIKDHFGVSPEETMMVGDRLYTDIAFGVNNNMHSVLVLTGETTLDMYKGGNIKATEVLDNLSFLKI